MLYAGNHRANVTYYVTGYKKIYFEEGEALFQV